MKTSKTKSRVSFRNTLIVGTVLLAALVFFQNCSGFGNPMNLQFSSQTSSSSVSPAATPANISYPSISATSNVAQSLRNQPLVVGGRLMIGSSAEISYANADPTYLATLGAEYNIVTPENSMKMDATQPTAASAFSSSAGDWNFSGGDALVQFAQSKNIKVRGHNLVWNNAIPTWLSSGNYTPDQLKQIMLNRITTEMTHFEMEFPGQVAYWDVVNEAVGAGCSTIWSVVDNPTNDPSQCLNYVTTAYQTARTVALAINPKIKLFYNDYGAEGTAFTCLQINIDKACAVYNLVAILKSKGLIDGVGLQMHWNAGANDPSTTDLKNNMYQLGQLGLEVQITELDDGLLNAPDASALFNQGLIYQSAIAACVAEPNCSAVLTWGFNDPTSWLIGQGKFAPLVFDSSHARKWSYFALQDSLGTNPGSTQLHPQGNANYCLDISGGGSEAAYLSGAPLQIYACGGGTNQSLYYDHVTQSLKAFVNTPQELCVQAIDGKGSIGSSLVLAACLSSSIQKFTFANGQLQDVNANCVTSATVANAAIPTLASCSTQSNWTSGATFGQNFVFSANSSGLCMSGSAGSILPAALLDGEPCGSKASLQAWTLASVSGKSGVEIISGTANLCLDVVGQGTVDGTPVQQYECASAGQSNQLWSLNATGTTYQVTSVASGKCLTMGSTGAVVISTCVSGNSSQAWQLK